MREAGARVRIVRVRVQQYLEDPIHHLAVRLWGRGLGHNIKAHHPGQVLDAHPEDALQVGDAQLRRHVLQQVAEAILEVIVVRQGLQIWLVHWSYLGKIVVRVGVLGSTDVTIMTKTQARAD